MKKKIKKMDRNIKNKTNSHYAIMEKKVNITCISYLSILLCPSKCLNQDIKNNNQAFLNFSNKLNNLLELDNILNSQKNVELIKNLLFNDKQRLAVNYVKFEFDNQLKEKDLYKEIETIKEYFTSKEKSLSENDIRILNMLNNDLFQF